MVFERGARKGRPVHLVEGCLGFSIAQGHGSTKSQIISGSLPTCGLQLYKTRHVHFTSIGFFRLCICRFLRSSTSWFFAPLFGVVFSLVWAVRKQEAAVNMDIVVTRLAANDAASLKRLLRSEASHDEILKLPASRPRNRTGTSGTVAPTKFLGLKKEAEESCIAPRKRSSR